MGAHKSQASGKPINHLLKEGLSWPVFAVTAGEPFDVVPEASVAIAARSGPLDRIASRMPPSVERTPLSASAAVGVGQPANAAAHSIRPRVPSRKTFSSDGVADPASNPPPLGVGQPARAAVVRRSIPPSPCLPGPVVSVRGVGHPVRSVSEMRRADARSRENGRPAGVACSFQVSENKVEPRPSSRAFNLLAKDCCRAMLANEPEPLGPQVTFVGETAALSSAREGLARTGTGPDFAITGPAGKGEGEGPAPDSGEEMTGVSDGNVEGSNIDN